MSVVAEVRRLREAEWKPAEIVRILAGQGITVSYNSVRRWTEPDFADRYREDNRLRMARRVAAGPSPSLQGRTVEYQEARLRVLIDAGVDISNAVRVMRLDFGEYWTRHRVERVLGVPRACRRRAGASAS